MQSSVATSPNSAEHPRAVDQVAAVVGVVAAHPQPQHRTDGHVGSPSKCMSAGSLPSFFNSACTMKFATSEGLVPGPKPASKPELQRQLVVDARPAEQEHASSPAARAPCATSMNCRRVVLVDVALGDHLGDEDGVRLLLLRLADQLLVGHLAAQVVGLEPGVALEPVVAGVALHVEDGVDAHGVGVGAGARAEDDHPPAELRSSISLLRSSKPSLRNDDLRDVDARVVERDVRPGVDDEEGVMVRRGLGGGDLHVREAEPRCTAAARPPWPCRRAEPGRVKESWMTPSSRRSPYARMRCDSPAISAPRGSRGRG